MIDYKKTVKNEDETLQNKLLGLEIIRFLSAMAVLVFHYSHFGFFQGTEFIEKEAPFYQLLWPFYRYGGFAVPIFWTLSGFIFFWKYKTLIQAKMISAKQFFVFRFSRLYPLHILTLISVAILQSLFFKWHHHYFIYSNNSLSDFLLHLFFASAWLGNSGQTFNGPIWSVSLEIIVYFLFFFSTRFLKNAFQKGIVIGALIFLLVKAEGYTNLIWCITCFYMGGLSAYLRESSSRLGYKSLVSIGVLLFLVAWILISIWLHLFIFPVFKMIFVIVMSMCSIYLLSEPFKFHEVMQKLIELFANITYSSYLMHFPIQLVIVLVYSFFGWNLPLDSQMFFIFYFGGIITVSIIAYRWFEYPLQKYIRKVLME